LPPPRNLLGLTNGTSQRHPIARYEGR
jgi:hypothetical protein